MRIALVVIMVVLLVGVAGANEWAVAYGDEVNAYGATSIQQTSDGGYVISGIIYDEYNGWIAKLDSNGSLMWHKIYSMGIKDVYQTNDGGYIAGGWNGTQPCILKLDSNGNIEWQKCYVNDSLEGTVWRIQQTDGGYVAIVMLDNGAAILKLNENGDVEWYKAYYNTSEGCDIPTAIQQTSDGGYIAVGQTSWLSGLSGYSYDVLILKLDKDGNIEWQKAYGGSGKGAAWAVQQTSDGGYIVVGSTESFGSDYYAWVLKLDENGNIEWQKAYSEGILLAVQEVDGGYVVAGWLEQYPGILKLDYNGNPLWQKGYNCIVWSDDWLPVRIFQQTSDGGYVIVGDYLYSYPDIDFAVLKLDSNGNIPGCNRCIDINAGVNATNTQAHIVNTSYRAIEILATTMYSEAAVTSTQLSLTYQCRVTVMMGDVNGDDEVTVVDAMFIAQYVAGIRELPNPAAADVNCDGEINVVDAMFIAQYIAGIRPSLGC